MYEYTIHHNSLDVATYQKLRKSTTWNELDDNVVEKALQKDLFNVSIFYGEQAVGMGRVIGDGAIYFYLQDIIVLPAFQKKGLGQMIMNEIEKFLQESTYPNTFIGLMAAKGVKPFYQKFGYQVRPDQGPGMYRLIKKETIND